jgi:hypothetical protein
MARQPRELAELQRALGRHLATLREAAGLYQTDIARAVPCYRTTVTHAEAGSQLPDADFWETADRVVGANGALISRYDAFIQVREAHKTDKRVARRARARSELATLPFNGGLVTPSTATSNDLQVAVWQGASSRGGDEYDALELARRVAASDVSAETLGRLEDMVDELAVRYPKTPPRELLDSVCRHISYVMRLIDARKTLDEHRRLLIVGGWLSLIAATLYVDLEQRAAANGWLATAASLAKQAGQSEIYAWRYETEAWQVLTDGDYHHAVELSQAAQQLAPRGSSVAIQATAQEGRAWARLGKAKEAYDALKRVEGYVSRMARPKTPEHHYRYDPDKAQAYVATTLAWLGDVASEHHARQVVATLTHEVEAGRWPRVASNHWRALEVVRTVELRGLPEAPELREAYELMRRKV